MKYILLGLVLCITLFFPIRLGVNDLDVCFASINESGEYLSVFIGTLGIPSYFSSDVENNNGVYELHIKGTYSPLGKLISGRRSSHEVYIEIDEEVETLIIVCHDGQKNVIVSEN